MGVVNNYSAKDEELVVRVVSVPSVLVPRDWQQPIGMPVPGMPRSPGSINVPPVPGSPGSGYPGGYGTTPTVPGRPYNYPGTMYGNPGMVNPVQPQPLRR